MKKTLIALAVLAAAGTSFAQVTVSGKLGFSYQKNANAAGGAANHGMQMADGDIGFKAVEDLGGGMSITADTRMKLRGRDTTIDGRDAHLTLVTGVGAFRLAAAETCSKLEDVMSGATSTSTGIDNTYSALDTCSNVDAASYIVPVGPFTGSLSYIEFVPGAGVASTVTAWIVGGTYSAGPLMVSMDHTAFQADKTASLVTTSGTVPGFGSYADGGTRTRLVGSYDFGVAKIGAGFQVKNKSAADQYLLSLAVPVGALTFGIDYANRAAQGNPDLDAAAKGAASAVYGVANGDDSRTYLAVGATYALSKTTSFNVTAAQHTGAGANSLTGAKAKYENEYRMRLMKSF